MALTEQERNIAQQVKEQWWSRKDVIEVISQFRARQPKQPAQEFKSLSQEARESLEKTPEEILWVKEFKDEKVVDVPEEPKETLWEKLSERVSGATGALTTKQTVFNPEFVSNLKNAVSQTEKWEQVINAIDSIGNIIEKIPWSEFIKNEIEQGIDRKLKWVSVAKEWAWAINDIIETWFTKLLEFTWLDEPIERAINAAAETDPWKAIWEVIADSNEVIEAANNVAPGLTNLLSAWWEIWELLWFGKFGRTWKETAQEISEKLKKRKEQKLEDKKIWEEEERIRTTAQILQAWDKVSDETLKTISRFIWKADNIKDIESWFKKSATDIIRKRNAIIKEANAPVTNTLLLTKSLVNKIDDLKKQWITPESEIKKFEEVLNRERSWLSQNKDQLDLVKVEKRKELLNKETKTLNEKKEKWTITWREEARLRALDEIRDSYKEFVETKTDEFFDWTENVWSVNSLNRQFWDLQTWLDLIKKEAWKIRKSEDPAWFVRDRLSKLPFIWEFIETPSVSAAKRREELLKWKTKKLEKLNK